MAGKEGFGLPIGCIAAGIAAAGLGWGVLAQSPQCGRGTMQSGTVCVSGDSQRTVEQKRSDNDSLGKGAIGVGVLLVLGGIVSAVSAANTNARVDEQATAREAFLAAQRRPPHIAVEQARADREAGVQARAVDSRLPALPQLLAWWAVLAAADAARNNGRYTAITATTATFGDHEGGSTLTLLPDRTAVLSGGVDISAQAAALREGGALPALFAGAPAWVTDSALDRRVHQRALTFCYWWDGTQWLMGDSPNSNYSSLAIPAVWTDESLARALSRWAGITDEAPLVPGVKQLVAAVMTQTATQELMAGVLPGNQNVDVAMQQLRSVGVTARV